MNRSFLIAQILLAAGAFGATPSLPLYFEPNQGQAHPQVEFLSRGNASLSYLTSREAIFTVGGSPVKMHLTGASSSKPEGIDRLPGTSSYFRGQDKTKWHTAIPQFAKVRYREVYPGVDLIYYGTGGNIEYDFQIAPGADPARIHIAYEGTTRLRLDRNGDLILSTKTGELRQRSPKVYQDIDGHRAEIAVSYKLDGRKNVGFTLAAYDRSKPLIVDPVLQYSTYFGGPGEDGGDAVRVDAAGNVYLGLTLAMPQSDANPFSSSATNSGGPFEGAVVKFSPTQNAILFVAHVGADGNTLTKALAIDAAGDMFLAGSTTSADFPLVNPIVPQNSGASAFGGMPFLTKIAADGTTLLYSTYFGGSGADNIQGLALDTTGNLYLAGEATSSNFPILNALYPSGQNAYSFLAKISPAGALIFSTLYPGTAGATAVAVDSTGVYMAAQAVSEWFPLTNSIQTARTPIQPPNGPIVGAVKFALDGQSVFYSSMFGGTLGETPFAAAVDAQGNFYIAGLTSSTDFPVVNAVQNTLGGDEDGFIAEVSPTGNSLVFATYLGGTGQDDIVSMALDSAANIYVVGTTLSANFPVLNSGATSIQKAAGQKTPYYAFVTAYSPGGKSMLYSMLVGGSQQEVAHAVAVDGTGNVYVVGESSSPDLPVTSNAYQKSFGGWWDAFMMVLGPTSASLVPSVAASPQVVSFTAPGNVAPPAQTVNLTAPAGAVFTTSVSTASGANWLSATLVGASQLSVAVNPAGLAQGTYSGTIVVSTGTGTPATISVVLIVPPPAAVLTSYSLTAASSPIPGLPGPLTIYGSGFVKGASGKVYLNGALGAGQPNYIYIEPESLAVVDANTVQFYTGVGSETPITIAVSVTNPGSVESNALPVLIGPPSPSITGVQNSAFASQPNSIQPVAPGEMITITGLDFGSPVGISAPANSGTPSTQLGNTQVLFNGVAVPITYVSFSQINALAPFSLNGALTANIAVNYLGVTSAPVTVQVVPSMTGLFTANSTGTGQGYILNQDGTLNSAANPAAAGSTVTVFATGMGATNPPIPDGTVPQSSNIPPVLPVAAMIGTQAANVVSAYAAPGLIGIFAASVQVPSGVSSGSAIPIQLGVGASQSQTGVTIAIK